MDEKYIEVKGIKIRYLEEGDSKQNLVLLHGLGGMADRWRPVIPLFSKKYKVVAPDLPGYGKSDKPQVDYTPDFFIKFVFDLLESLSLDEIKILGTSLGGQIAAECAATENQVIKKIVLVAPAGIMKKSTPVLDAYTMAAMYPTHDTVKTAYEMMMDKKKEVAQHTIENFITNMSRPNAKMAFLSTLLGLKNSPPITEKLPLINIPVLIIWGSNDQMIPLEYSKEFTSIKNCKLVVMEGCGHIPYDEKPQEFSDLVLNFLYK